MGAKRIVVDLGSQTVTASDGGKVFYTCECVSGDVSHVTPKGKFAVLRKEHPYTSKKYKVPMNYAMFFTTEGEALHQYHGPAPWWLLTTMRDITTAIGSHGCVRLKEEDAKKLYNWASIRTAVEVT
jgi:lipoprotein-anchoring transpeptidase ErfK/SrfK